MASGSYRGFRLAQWSGKRASGAFGCSDVPQFVGVSGGRTSALMAILAHPSAILTFQNTGREHPGTYDFLEELDDRLGKRIVWLEWRPPPRRGDRPRDFGFAVVDAKTADRSGAPFEGFLDALAAYRETKGEGPIAPWALQRICTAYMKNRVQEAYVESHGVETFESLIGLRADEPKRVYRLKGRDTQARTYRVPLFDAGIDKPAILEFWSRQDFDLRIADHQGNCTGCFLKDQSDISRVLGEPETDAEWWQRIAARFPDFGGRGFPGYERLLREREPRIAVEQWYREKRAGDPVWSEQPLLTKKAFDGDARRFRLVVLQERRRFRYGSTSFACGDVCEAQGSDTLAET